MALRSAPPSARSNPTGQRAELIVVGACGLAGGMAGSMIGAALAANLVGQPAAMDPGNLIGNAILFTGVLLAMGVGAVVGFAVGTAALPLVVLLLLGWQHGLRTALFTGCIATPMIPPAIWAVLRADQLSTTAGTVALWVFAIVIGAGAPILARILVQRRVLTDQTP